MDIINSVSRTIAVNSKFAVVVNAAIEEALKSFGVLAKAKEIQQYSVPFQSIEYSTGGVTGTQRHDGMSTDYEYSIRWSDDCHDDYGWIVDKLREVFLNFPQFGYWHDEIKQAVKITVADNVYTFEVPVQHYEDVAFS